MKINCPHCKAELYLDAKAIIPAKQKLTAKLTLGNGFIGAQTIGDFISNMSKTLKIVAEELHEHVEVFVSDSRFKKKEVEIDFVIAKIKDITNAKH